MKFPPITNATLTRVDTLGFTDDYDRPETAGANKWLGTEDVYLSETLDHVMRGERKDRRGERDDILLRRTLLVDANLPVTWDTGDVVTMTYNGVSEIGHVRRIITTEALGVGLVRIVLEND